MKILWFLVNKWLYLVNGDRYSYYCRLFQISRSCIKPRCHWQPWM